MYLYTVYSNINLIISSILGTLFSVEKEEETTVTMPSTKLDEEGITMFSAKSNEEGIAISSAKPDEEGITMFSAKLDEEAFEPLVEQGELPSTLLLTLYEKPTNCAIPFYFHYITHCNEVIHVNPNARENTQVVFHPIA